MGRAKGVYCIMCDNIAALWWLPGAGVGMVVRFAGSYIIKSNDAPRASAGKGGCVGSGRLADHSDLLQVQDLVSFTHHVFDRQF